jgi:hypothetical protein
MICILAFLKDLAGPCFIGFAIGESLGASALRICGGIFTKIAAQMLGTSGRSWTAPAGRVITQGASVSRQ